MGGSGLAFYGTHRIVSTSYSSSGLGIECRLFCWISYSLRNILVNFEIFFSIRWISWEPVQQVAWWQPCFINTLHCFGRLSLIRARNWVPFVLLDSLFSEEYFGKISDFISTGWSSWEPVQQVLLGSSSFNMFWPPFLLWFGHLGSKALVGHL